VQALLEQAEVADDEMGGIDVSEDEIKRQIALEN